MMIELEGTLARSVTGSLTRLAEIVSLHSTNGTWDLVAHIETSSLPEFDRVLREVREIKGVLNSETSILLNKATASDPLVSLHKQAAVDDQINAGNIGCSV